MYNMYIQLEDRMGLLQRSILDNVNKQTHVLYSIVVTGSINMKQVHTQVNKSLTHVTRATKLLLLHQSMCSSFKSVIYITGYQPMSKEHR